MNHTTSLPRRIAACLAATLAAAHVAAAPAAAPLTADAQTVLQWVQRAHDNAGAPFLVLDKRAARIWVFDAAGKSVGSSPVLVGSAVGDDSAPGIGDKPLAQVLPEEKTTPAGRFPLEIGRNLRGEDVFWIDYDAAVSMHRVLTTNPKERRLQRLATPTPADNRISFGCVNVPVAFFEQTLLPTLKGTKAIAYVLPEVHSLQSTFAFGRQTAH
jgi:hypothetical protein